MSSHSRVWGKAPAAEQLQFGAYLSQKEWPWWQHFYGFRIKISSVFWDEWVNQFCRQLAWKTNKIWRVWWEALCWWEAWGPGPLPLKSALGGPKIGRRWGPDHWEGAWVRDWPLETRYCWICVSMPNSIILGQTTRA